MSQPLTVARPYARAAFELAAASRESLGDWSGKLAFAAEVAAEPQVTALLGSPRIGGEQLRSLFVPAGVAADSPFAHFIALLAENQRLQALPEIAALFEQRKHDAERILHVRVRTATELDDGEMQTMTDALKRRFGRDIELEQALDPAILGGAIIDAGDVVIDGSVRGRLQQLEVALTC